MIKDYGITVEYYFNIKCQIPLITIKYSEIEQSFIHRIMFILECIGCKPVDPVSGPVIFKSYLESLLLQNKQPEIVLIIISNESYVSYIAFCYSS